MGAYSAVAYSAVPDRLAPQIRLRLTIMHICKLYSLTSLLACCKKVPEKLKLIDRLRVTR